MSTSQPVYGRTQTQEPPAYSPGLDGVIAGTTAISNVNPERQSLMYRGYDIRDLVDHASFEEVAYLLLNGDLPTQSELSQFDAELKANRQLPFDVADIYGKLPKTAHPMDQLKVGAALIGLYDTHPEDTSEPANKKRALQLTAQFSTLIAATYRVSQGQAPITPDNTLGHAENFLYMIHGEKPTADVARVFEQTLLCYMDHGFNASTFAGRVTISTLSDIFSAVTSAVGTLKGPLHGGANEAAMEMLLEIGTPENAEAWVKNALATKRKIMGFGHRAYKSGDPRAKVLGERARQLAEQLGQTKWSEMAKIVEDTMDREKGIHANVDFPTAYLYYMLGLPIPLYTPIFGLARIVGWTANFIEQLQHNKLYRPKAIYDGHGLREWTPINER